MREGLTLAEAREAFLLDVRIAHARLTHATYRHKLRSLTDADWPLTKATCRNLIAREIERGVAVNTVATFGGALSAFCKWLTDQGHYAENPMRGVAYPKADTGKPHRVLSPDEQARVWQACADDADRLALILLGVGLRASELLSVKREDIDDGLILIKGKGSRWRYVPCPPEAAPYLPASGPLFAFGYRGLLYRVTAMGKRAKVARVHPHLFRHTFCTDAVQHFDIPTVQAVMGHASPRMTERYSQSMFKKAAAAKMRDAATEAEIWASRAPEP